MTNKERYDGTWLEGVRQAEIGTPIEDLRSETSFELQANTSFEELVHEPGDQVQGRLHRFDEIDRENVKEAEEADGNAPGEWAAAVRWTRPGTEDAPGKDDVVIHLLTAEDLAEVERTSVSLLLKRISKTETAGSLRALGISNDDPLLVLLDHLHGRSMNRSRRGP